MPGRLRVLADLANQQMLAVGESSARWVQRPHLQMGVSSDVVGAASRATVRLGRDELRRYHHATSPSRI